MSDRPVPLRLAAAALPLTLFLLLPLAGLLGAVPLDRVPEVLRGETARAAFALSLATTTIATLLCVTIGLPVAWLLARHRFPGRAALDALVDVPVVIPPVVAGLALLLAFGRRGLLGRPLALLGVEVGFTRVAVILAQALVASPFFVRAARAGFETVEPRLEQAALTLGASRWRAFWTVNVPAARPALLAGLLLTWARALSEFGATMMFAGNLPGRTQTLPLAVMSAMESDLDTAVTIAALSLALGLALLLAARALAHRGGHGA